MKIILLCFLPLSCQLNHCTNCASTLRTVLIHSKMWAIDLVSVTALRLFGACPRMAEAMQARIGFLSKPWTSEAKLGENFEFNRNDDGILNAYPQYWICENTPDQPDRIKIQDSPRQRGRPRWKQQANHAQALSQIPVHPYCNRYFLFASIENVSLQNAAPSIAEEQKRNTSVFLEELCVSHTDLIWFDFVMGVAGFLSDAKPRTRQARRRPRPSPRLPRRKR